MNKKFHTPLMLILAFTFCCASGVLAQSKISKTAIADETVYRQSGQSSFAIVTNNDKVFSLVVKKFEPILVRYTVNYKKDRHGRYREVTIYFKNTDQDTVLTYIKSL